MAKEIKESKVKEEPKVEITSSRVEADDTIGFITTASENEFKSAVISNPYQDLADKKVVLEILILDKIAEGITNKANIEYIAQLANVYSFIK
jgi:hypothetical protein